MLHRWLLPSAAVCFALGLSPTAQAVELELALHGGLVLPTEGDDTLAPAGPIGGITPLVRLSRPIAVGVLVEHSRLAWNAAGPEPVTTPVSGFPDDDGRMQTTLVTGVLRWYVVDVAPAHPYLQLGLGWSDHIQIPDHPSCSVETGLGAQIAAGGDFGFSSWGRLGLSAAAFPFFLGQSCSESGFAGDPPDPPFPGIGIALQINLTTVWSPSEKADHR